jgi:hypothetical protein
MSLRDGTISLSSVQDFQPLDIKLSWNLSEQRLVGSFACDRLFPLEWVQLRGISAISDDLRRIMFSGSASVAWTKTESLSWAIKMRSIVPENVYGGANISVDCSGRNGIVDVRECSISGDRYDIAYSGSINLSQGLPDGFLSVKKCILPNGVQISGDLYIDRGRTAYGYYAVLSIGDAYFSGIEVIITNTRRAYDFAFSGYDTSGHSALMGHGPAMPEILSSFRRRSTLSASPTDFRRYFHLPCPIRRICGIVLRARGPYLLTTEVYFRPILRICRSIARVLLLRSAVKDGLYALFSLKGTGNGIDVTISLFHTADMIFPERISWF